MGSLTSRPQIPQAQRPVIFAMPPPSSPPPAPSSAAPQGTAASAPANTASPQSSTDGGGGTSGAEAARLAREDNLLRRSRGRIGTVLTGLGGALSKASTPVRKTLLGE